MRTQAATDTAVESVRRVVDGLLRGDCRGRFVCSGCLVKLTRDHLDKSYATIHVRPVREDEYAVPRGAASVSAAIRLPQCRHVERSS